MAQLLKLVDGSIFKVDGKDVVESIRSGVVKQVDVLRRKMTMVGTDETTDREGDIVVTGGGKLENYRKNPVFLWSHNYSSVPIARAEKIIKKRDPVRMEFHLLYPTKGLHPFADMILDLYGESFINASSIGFIPNKWEDIEREGEPEKNSRRPWYPRKFVDWELLELSGCAVPCNPNALQDALKGKSFTDLPFDEVQRFLQGQALPPKPLKADDIMQELSLKIADFVDESNPVMIQVPKELCLVEEESPKEKDGCEPWEKDEIGQDVQFEEKDYITKEEVEKPYPNEHACRLESPDNFDKFARKNCHIKHDGRCIDCIFGIKDGKSKMQAMRYPKDSWKASDAKAHCKTHEGSFEAASGASLEEPLDSKTTQGWEVLLGEIVRLVTEVRNQNAQVLEAVKSLKPTEPDPAQQPTDQGSNGGEEGKAASEAILEEAFEQGKGRPDPAPAPPPRLQYDFKGVIEALKDLKNSVKI